MYRNKKDIQEKLVKKIHREIQAIESKIEQNVRLVKTNMFNVRWSLKNEGGPMASDPIYRKLAELKRLSASNFNVCRIDDIDRFGIDVAELEKVKRQVSNWEYELLYLKGETIFDDGFALKSSFEPKKLLIVPTIWDEEKFPEELKEDFAGWFRMDQKRTRPVKIGRKIVSLYTWELTNWTGWFKHFELTITPIYSVEPIFSPDLVAEKVEATKQLRRKMPEKLKRGLLKP